MSIDPVAFCLNISLAHASLSLKLDEELGTLHGVSFSDFTLLYLLAQAEGGRLPVTDLVRPMGVQLSAVTRQLVLLEKTGLAQRESDPSGDGKRYAAIRPAGKKLLNAAMVATGEVCSAALRTLQAQSVPVVDEALSTLRRTDVLDL